MKYKIHIPIRQFAFIEIEGESLDETEIKKIWKRWYNYFEKPIKTNITEANYNFETSEQADLEALEAIINQ